VDINQHMIFQSKKILKFLLQIVITWGVLVILFISILFVRDKYYLYKLNLCDIDHDGIFAVSEQTDTWSYYENKVIDDGGRALIPFYLPVIFCISIIINYCRSMIKKIIIKLKVNTKECKK